MKSLALASKVKSLALASRPQVLENWPVLGSRTELFCCNFVNRLKKNFKRRFLLENARKKFLKTFFFGNRLKKLVEDLFFGKHLRLCPWSLALASSIPVLGLERVCPRKGCPWPWPRAFLSLASRGFVLGRAVLGLGFGFFCVLGLGLEPCVLDSTSVIYYLVLFVCSVLSAL